MTSPAVEAVGLSKRFGTREVLKGIDLRIAPGRVTGLVGPNAAGKTTLIKIVLGLVRADRVASPCTVKRSTARWTTGERSGTCHRRRSSPRT